MTYEEMMAMIGQGQDAGSLEDQIKMQMAQADQLRQNNVPQMRQAGAVHVAPHPLEVLGGLAREYASNQQQEGAAANQKKIRNLKQEQFAAMLRQLAGQGTAPGGQQPAGNGFQPPRGPQNMGMQMPSGPTGLQVPQGY